MASAPLRAESGQASVELVALLPLLGVLALGIWQVAVAGHAIWSASAAARAAARAAAVGGDDDARRAARAIAGHGVRVRETEGGGVRVTVPIRAVASGAVLAKFSTTTRFEPQR